MEDNKIDFEQIRAQISVTSFLQRLGYEPVRYSGGEHFYRSMLRDGDRVPSFCVNDKLGLWYDHGLGKGGSVIDFAKEYWPQLNFREAVNMLMSTMNISGETQQRRITAPRQLEIPLRHPSYVIVEDRPLGGNKKITDYLSSRGVYDVAGSDLRELYYWVKPEGKQKMSFSAAGWQNELGGWEVRSAAFKGCLGQKGINLIPANPDKVSMFEGMMDYLSWKTLFPHDNSSIVVLNSLSLLPQGVTKAMNYAMVDFFFDHDAAGLKASLHLQQTLPRAIDRSSLYQDFNDLNEKLQADIGRKVNQLSENKQEKSNRNR